MDDITLAKRLFVLQYCHSCSYNCIGKVFSVFFLYFLFHALWPEHPIFVYKLCFIFSSRMPELQILCLYFLFFFQFSPKLVNKMFWTLKHWLFFSIKITTFFAAFFQVFLNIVSDNSSFLSYFPNTIDF